MTYTEISAEETEAMISDYKDGFRPRDYAILLSYLRNPRITFGGLARFFDELSAEDVKQIIEETLDGFNLMIDRGQIYRKPRKYKPPKKIERCGKRILKGERRPNNNKSYYEVN